MTQNEFNVEVVQLLKALRSVVIDIAPDYDYIEHIGERIDKIEDCLPVKPEIEN